jgi:hypothetical protein
MLFVSRATPLGPNNKRIPQGLKAAYLADSMPGMNPRPTARESSSPHSMSALKPWPSGPNLPLEPIRQRVNPIQKLRMHESPIDETALSRIRSNIPKLPPKILTVANPMLVEAGLPDFPGKLLPHFMRKAALDALSATLNGLVRCRRQQNMQMFRHHNEPMQLIPPLIPIVEESLHQQFRICRSNEERAPLVRCSGERIGFHGRLRKAYLRG